jgi:DMSO/TMAO reductase YedYZ molybdopterin-dependent catalytic subunit
VAYAAVRDCLTIRAQPRARASPSPLGSVRCRHGHASERGQRAIDDFPRFGLQQFQYRFPDRIERLVFEVGGDVEKPLLVEERFLQLPRTKQVSDLHCVTTWSKCGLEWSGVRFRDFYEQLVVPGVRPEADARLVVLRGQDGNRASLPLEDLLADDVLLADTLDGQPLSIAHGAPVRLVAPGHYGYKNFKHLRAIEFWRDARHYRYPAPSFLDLRERASIAKRERSAYRIGWYDRSTDSQFPPHAGSLASSSNETPEEARRLSRSQLFSVSCRSLLGRTARWQRPVLATGTGCDVEDLARLGQENAVPYASRDDQGLPGREGNPSRGLLVLEHDGDIPGKQEEKLVAVRMHLTSVRWLSGHERRSDGEAIDSRRRTGSPRYLTGLTVTMKPDDCVRQVDRAARLIRHDASEMLWCHLTNRRPAADRRNFRDAI